MQAKEAKETIMDNLSWDNISINPSILLRNSIDQMSTIQPNVWSNINNFQYQASGHSADDCIISSKGELINDSLFNSSLDLLQMQAADAIRVSEMVEMLGPAFDTMSGSSSLDLDNFLQQHQEAAVRLAADSLSHHLQQQQHDDQLQLVSFPSPTKLALDPFGISGSPTQNFGISAKNDLSVTFASGGSSGNFSSSGESDAAANSQGSSQAESAKNRRNSSKRKLEEHSFSGGGGGGFQIFFERLPKSTKRQRSESGSTGTTSNIDFRQESKGLYEPDTEAIAQVKEMIYRAAAMRPVNLVLEEVAEKPKRKNVRISSDPQTVAARHRRERISDRLRVLQKLVPGGNKMDTASMLDEAANYLKFLRSQVTALETLGSTPNSSNPSSNSNPNPIPFTTTATALWKP